MRNLSRTKKVSSARVSRFACLLLTSSLLLVAGVSQAQVAAPVVAVPPVKTPVSAEKVPQYDVISIKPNKSGSGHISISVDDGNYTASNIELKGLISSAYDIKEDLISGLSGWANSAHYDIKAKVIAPDMKVLDALSPEQWRSMLLPMLERFHLKCHIEVKTLPIYELVVAKGGPKFAKASASATFNGVSSGGVSTHNQHLTAHDVSLEGLVNQLSYTLHRTVIDKTGLKDKYDFELVWSREDTAAAMSADSNRTKADAGDAPPVIETAIQEQLGLKLVSAKGPVNTLVVDSVEPPTED